MPLEFQARVRDMDMYRFNMYHAYTSMQGIFSLVVGAVLLALAIVSAHRLDAGDMLLYVGLAVVLVAYVPISLWFRSKCQIAMSEVLQQPISYSLQKQGIVVTSPASEESATLPWESVYKVVTTRNNLLIYSNRVNAYVIPREAVQAQFPQMRQIFEEHVENYRLRIK